MALLVDMTSGRGGTELKDGQYLRQEYTDTAYTAYNVRIGAIAARVRDRLAAIRQGGAA